MKRHWLRGLLLGVSMALLVAGGVALAQQNLTASIDTECVECIPATYAADPGLVPVDPYLWTITSSGWAGGEDVDPSFTFASGRTEPWYGA